MEALKRQGLTSGQTKKFFLRVSPTYQRNFKYVAKNFYSVIASLVL